MSFRKVEASDVVQQENKTPQLLPEGFYSVVLTGVGLRETKATQGMLNVFFMPLHKDGDPKTGDPSFEIKHMVLSDVWSDDETFRDSKTEKLASKWERKISEISEDQVDEAVEKARHMAQQGMFRAAKAILGSDLCPDVPKFDYEIRKFVDAAGNTHTKEGKDAMYNEAVAWGCNQISDIASGALDVTGYVCYAKVVHSTFNGFTSLQVKSLYETLPEGESLTKF